LPHNIEAKSARHKINEDVMVLNIETIVNNIVLKKPLRPKASIISLTDDSQSKRFHNHGDTVKVVRKSDTRYVNLKHGLDGGIRFSMLSNFHGR